MAKGAYPNMEDLHEFLQIAGIHVDPKHDLSRFIEEAIALWEKSTGWKPFLAIDEYQTRVFKAPVGGRSGDFCYVPLVELSGGVVDVRSVHLKSPSSGARHILIEGTDFLFMPEDAPRMGRSYEWIEFIRPSIRQGDLVEVDGLWGYCSELPEDVRSCILKLAASEVVSLCECSLGGGLKSWSEEGVREEYDRESYEAVVHRWKSESRRLVACYRRFKLGV